MRGDRAFFSLVVPRDCLYEDSELLNRKFAKSSSVVSVVQVLPYVI